MRKQDRSYFYGKTGQRLLVQEWGAEDQPVVLLVHGFPGCADHGGLMALSSMWGSFRLIAMDRPGYGQSDLQKKLTPLKFAEQIKEFLDEIKIDKLSIITVSGGAPFAMAVAYLLKDRVLKLTSVAGVAPLTIKNSRYMSSQQRRMWMLRRLVPQSVLEFAMHRMWEGGIDKIDQFLFSESNAFSLPDQKVFANPTVGPILISTLRTALAQGPGAILEDLSVYVRSWGFPLDEITCPVTLWHGSSDDVVHYKYAEEMKSLLAKAELKFISDEGHYSLSLNCRDAIIADLLRVNSKV
jgi:pimeloyl-ACP methyl ester carboxylesterase